VGWQVGTLTGHSGEVRSVAISRDGKWVVSGSYDRLVKIWDVATGAEVSNFVVRCGLWGDFFVGVCLANGFDGGLM
jgi:WD40 repeat protein